MTLHKELNLGAFKRAADCRIHHVFSQRSGGYVERFDLGRNSVMVAAVRDLEDALDRMKSEAAAQAGQARTLARGSTETFAKIKTDKGLLSKILAGSADNKNDLAKARAQEVVTLQSSMTYLNKP